MEWKELQTQEKANRCTLRKGFVYLTCAFYPGIKPTHNCQDKDDYSDQ